MPGRVAWQHVSRTSLFAAADRAKTLIAARTGGPCWICGSTLSAPGTVFVQLAGGRSPTRQPITICGRCEAWLDSDLVLATDGIRNLVASVLVGQSTPGHRGWPPRLAADVGCTLWFESGRKTGSADPFSYLDLPKLRANVQEKGIATTVDPGRWRLAVG